MTVQDDIRTIHYYNSNRNEKLLLKLSRFVCVCVCVYVKDSTIGQFTRPRYPIIVIVFTVLEFFGSFAQSKI